MPFTPTILKSFRSLLDELEQNHTRSLVAIRRMQEELRIPTPPDQVAVGTSLNKTEREMAAVVYALEFYQFNRRLAANSLGISERTLYRKLDRFGLATHTRTGKRRTEEEEALPRRTGINMDICPDHR